MHTAVEEDFQRHTDDAQPPQTQHKDKVGRLQESDQRVRSFVAERPLTALLGAVAVGFVVGRLLARA